TDIISEDNVPRLADLIEPWFIFSFVWSLGASCDNDSRVKFDAWLRQTMADNNIALKFPSVGLVYDYKLDDAGIVSQEEEEEEGGERVRGL
ncbi:unnamed protein product, partial [Lymnaea stagnalis]